MLKSWGLNKEEVDVVEIRNPKKEQDGRSACDEVEKKSRFHPSLSTGARVVPPLLSGPRRMQSFAPVEIPLWFNIVFADEEASRFSPGQRPHQAASQIHGLTHPAASICNGESLSRSGNGCAVHFPEHLSITLRVYVR